MEILFFQYLLFTYITVKEIAGLLISKFYVITTYNLWNAQCIN